jgi:hypothetical protein
LDELHQIIEPVVPDVLLNLSDPIFEVLDLLRHDLASIYSPVDFMQLQEFISNLLFLGGLIFVVIQEMMTFEQFLISESADLTNHELR